MADYFDIAVATRRKLKAQADAVTAQAHTLKTIAGSDWSELSGPPDISEPFDEQALAAVKAGEMLPVYSTVLGEWMVWVRGEKERQTLVAEGCPLPIYILTEVVTATTLPADMLPNVHAFKREFGARLTEHFSRDSGCEKSEISEISHACGPTDNKPKHEPREHT